jgi:hypothetical protein
MYSIYLYNRILKKNFGLFNCVYTLSQFPIWYESGSRPYSLMRGMMEMESCIELVGESSVLFVRCKLVDGNGRLCIGIYSCR